MFVSRAFTGMARADASTWHQVEDRITTAPANERVAQINRIMMRLAGLLSNP
ncbi:MAG: hypothetical protein ACRDY2_05775 [Acidimicrobiales bacterium]